MCYYSARKSSLVFDGEISKRKIRISIEGIKEIIIQEQNKQVINVTYTNEEKQVTKEFIDCKIPDYIYDYETGLFYYNSRYYSPELCRWLTPDSIEYLDPESINGLNLYCYCGNNPVMYADPDGHMPKWAMWLIGGVVIAGLAIATIATGGAAGGVAGFILAGALKGAVIGAVSGALVNGTISGISAAIEGDKFWTGFLDGAAHGFMSGAVIGGITGAISSGVQVYNASKLWANTGYKTAYRQMVDHYGKHVIGEGQKSIAKNIVNYSKQASQFFANNSSAGVALRSGVVKIYGAPGGIFNIDGLIRSFWYI